MSKRRRIDWHRLFGIALVDYFARSGYEVELEVDLSLKKQLLDLVIIEKKSGRRIRDICDGLEDLAKVNLVTYKSMRESLTVWALAELIGHYVNYRKSRGVGRIKPTDVQLYAVCTRFPAGVARKVGLEPLSEGVYTTPVLVTHPPKAVEKNKKNRR